MKRLAFALLALGALCPSPSRAQSDLGDPARLYSHRARVTQTGATAYRLPLSSEVLAVCRPDLSDVRLFAYGGEIPWMLDSAGRVVDGTGEQLSEIAAPILQTPAHDVEGPPRTPTAFHEAYEIPAAGEPPSRARWELVLGSVREHFVADVHVVGIAPDGTEHEIGTSSVFRFVAPLREQLRVPVEGAATDRIRVEVRSREGFLDPTFTWVATRRARAGEEMVVPLTVVSQRHQGGQTVLELERPNGVVPELLRFTTTTTTFSRAVHVESGSRSIDASVWRVPGDAGAEMLEVRAPAGSTPTLAVRIDDGDSPPLEGLTVAAVLSRPVLVYFTQAEELRFGGGRVRAPHYDLAALQGSWAIDQLLDGTMQPEEAVLGPIEPTPGWTDAPALASLQRAGVAVPPGDHAFVAPLEVTAAREGASRFVLDASVLAAAREDLADLRIVDAEGRQWPYLLREVDALRVPVTVGAATPAGTDTRYELTLPVARVVATELRVDPSAELVARPVQIVGTDARGDEIGLGASELSRYPGETPGPIFVSLSGLRTSSLAMLVTDGSDAPLAFRSAEISIPTREVVLVAPPGSYRVRVGDDDAQPPTYEIEVVRGLLDAIPLDDATLGAIGPSPDYHVPTFWEQNGASTVALWAVLVLAIVVLGGLTWRASREPEAAPASAGPAAPAETPAAEVVGAVAVDAAPAGEAPAREDAASSDTPAPDEEPPTEGA